MGRALRRSRRISFVCVAKRGSVSIERACQEFVDMMWISRADLELGDTGDLYWRILMFLWEMKVDIKFLSENFELKVEGLITRMRENHHKPADNRKINLKMDVGGVGPPLH